MIAPQEWENKDDKRRVVQKIWSLLCSNQMVTIDIPSWLAEDSRKSIVSYIDSHSKRETPLTVFRGMITIEEGSSITNLVSYSPNLTEIQIRRGATDHLMQIIGRCCPNIREINM